MKLFGQVKKKLWASEVRDVLNLAGFVSSSRFSADRQPEPPIPESNTTPHQGEVAAIRNKVVFVACHDVHDKANDAKSVT